MYYLIDIISGTTVYKAADKRDLLGCWARVATTNRDGSLNFRELNVTGNDTVAEWVMDGRYFFPDGRACPTYTEQLRLRRFQVKDDKGCSCDIRVWEEDIHSSPSGGFWYSRHYGMPERLPEFRREPALQGGKKHYRRMSYPAMAHGTLRDLYAQPDVDADEDSPVCPSDIPPVRYRGVNRYTTYDLAETKYFNRGSRSWKENSKSRRQWGKHKHTNDRASIRYFYAGTTLEDILQSIKSDSCAVPAP